MSPPIRILIAAMGVVLAPAHARAEELRPTELGEGIFLIEAATAPRFVGANVGVVEFEEHVLVIDPGFAPVAQFAKEWIASRFGKPVRFVVDTHLHADHAFANQLFTRDGAVVVAHESAATLTSGASAAAFAAQDGERAAANRGDLAYVAPQVLVTDRMVIEDATRRVEILHLGPGHTAGDLVVHLPAAGIVFTGDLAVNGAFNYFGDADPESWRDALERLAALGATSVAPGHGPAGDASIVSNQRRYLEELTAAVRRGVASGAGLEAIREALDMPWYREWTGVEARERGENLARIYAFEAGLEAPARWIAELGLVAERERPRDAAGWRAPRRVVIASWLSANWLAPVAPGVELIVAESGAQAAELAADADAVVGFCSNEILARGRDLEWVAVSSAGVERYVDLEAWAGLDCRLTNAQRIHGPPIAEHVMALILALTRGLDDALAAQARSEWSAGAIREEGLLELRGKTLLVAGLGGIGTEVARLAHGIGMRVIATKRRVDGKPEFVARLGGASDLTAYAAEADVVVNCLPLTRETTGLFDAAFFAGAKRGAIFVNIGRGRSVVTADLLAALASGRLGGAGLDVTDPEPLPKEHPLWRAGNVIVTPHVSAGTDAGRDRIARLHRENLRRFVLGEPLLNVVDRAAGY
jgi:phosphoglycerate dehydrogenase-like enzyme/glyoxylase-like metal-dependent hydrolase (beta-lactamase superfamily II)